MWRKCFFLLLLVHLGGCVTQKLDAGSQQPLLEPDFEPQEAARTRIALGLNYLQKGDYVQAKFNLDKALNFAPDLAEVHYSLAYYFQRVGESAQAKNAYLAALDIEPDNPDTLNNYGVFLCQQGDFSAAEDNFRRAILQPSYLRVAESYENLGLCALKVNNFYKSEKYLRHAIEHSPRRASSLLNMSYINFAKSDLIGSQRFLEAFEKYHKITEQSLGLAIQIALERKDKSKARSYGHLLLSLYPDSDAARRFKTHTWQNSYANQLKRRYEQSQIKDAS